MSPHYEETTRIVWSRFVGNLILHLLASPAPRVMPQRAASLRSWS